MKNKSFKMRRMEIKYSMKTDKKLNPGKEEKCRHRLKIQ